MFCDPCAQSDLPTNTTSASAYSPISSPVVSASSTGGAPSAATAGAASPRERRTHLKPALRMFASTASAFSKCRGAITSTGAGPSAPFTRRASKSRR